MAPCTTAWTAGGRLLIRKVQVESCQGRQLASQRVGVPWRESPACSDGNPPAATRDLEMDPWGAGLGSTCDCIAPRGSGTARPHGALRAIDSTARPRLGRTAGPRRLRRQSESDLVPHRETFALLQPYLRS